MTEELTRMCCFGLHTQQLSLLGGYSTARLLSGSTQYESGGEDKPIDSLEFSQPRTTKRLGQKSMG